MTGCGTAGAYHAGVLRALQEAGVKIDLVAGRGMGTVSAMFAAVDGGSRLWESGGLWRGGVARRFYHWRASLRAAAWMLAAASATLLFPLVFLVVAVLVYPVAYLFRLAGSELGAELAARYGQLLATVFGPTALPMILPRIVLLILLGLLVMLAINAAVSAWLRVRRRARGAIWWRMFGTLLSATDVRDRFARALWKLIRGAAPITRPSAQELSRGYTELLIENLGQPGFRELVVTAHDVDTRRDLVFALLAEPYRRRFFRRPAPDGGRRAFETWDLAGAGRDLALDALAASVCLPVVTEPHLVTFAPESQWRGETHRVCDRPDGAARVLEEVLNAGAEQAVVVSSTAELAGPHALSAGRGDARGRAGEYLASVEAAAVRDAVTARVGHFQGLFLIRPTHNPLGPFDFRGSYDERSDRRHTLAELVDRGYQDAYRQFVDPVIGASGERLDTVT